LDKVVALAVNIFLISNKADFLFRCVGKINERGLI